MRAVQLAWLLALGTAALLGPLSSPAEAQYFGRNKVQYRTFHFEVLKTEHFDVYFYPQEQQLAQEAGRMAERWYARHARTLGYELTGRQPLILYASHPDFTQTNAIPGDLGEGTGGVTEALKRRIVLPLAGPLAETDHVIGHELVHAFQYDVTGQRPTSAGFAEPAILRLPLWFIEGMAEYLSLGPVDPNTAMWMRDAAQSNKLPSVRQLNNPRYFPYRYGQALWAYIAHRWGEPAVAACLRAAGRSGDAEAALTAELGVSMDSLSGDWHRSIRAWYAPIAAVTQPPSASGRSVEAVRRGRGELNIAPALSPDGRQLVFFSERGLFSIEMYLADLEKNRIVRQITKSALDPHIQSLEFIQSAGAWSADGRRFVYSGISAGKPMLIVLDMASHRKVREIDLSDLGEVLNPTWSPDGSRVAFAALTGGATDLFWAEVATGRVRRLTNDLYADLEPAWSPDGRTLAFVTDRYSTDVVALRYGAYSLASYDVASGEIKKLDGPRGDKVINPQWSGDGGTLFFVADPDGIPNVYRMPAAGGEPVRLTNLHTGVSGITALSPAISVARDTDRLVFTAYEGGKYEMYTIDGAAHAPAAGTETALAALQAGTIPIGGVVTPVDSDSVYAKRPLLRPVLPATASFQTRAYRPKLSLDYIAQPSIALGTTGSGLAAGGGAAAFWSDMLGDHNLATFLQINTGGGSILKNTAIGSIYQNLKHRWNWGVGATQVPLITTNFAVDNGSYNGEPATREQNLRFWEIHRDAFGLISYPLSPVQRVELSGGFSNVSFSGEVETHIFSDNTGNELFRSTDPLFATPIASLNFATSSLALVYDNSVFGGTSPILGQSYRFEGGVSAGTINYFTALADVRRYVPLVHPLVLAGRVVHYGRYGSGAEDFRLQPLFLGYGTLIRGYNDGSFDASMPGDTTVFGELFGTRLALGNVELRLPVLGGVGLVPSRGFPPVEVGAFYDAGVAWDRSVKPRFLNGTRRPLTSYGALARINLLGFAVAEIDYVHPNDRPEKGWYWQFNLSPGF